MAAVEYHLVNQRRNSSAKSSHFGTRCLMIISGSCACDPSIEGRVSRAARNRHASWGDMSAWRGGRVQRVIDRTHRAVASGGRTGELGRRWRWRLRRESRGWRGLAGLAAGCRRRRVTCCWGWGLRTGCTPSRRRHSRLEYAAGTITHDTKRDRVRQAKAACIAFACCRRECRQATAARAAGRGPPPARAAHFLR